MAKRPDRRDLILTAATSVFARHGYAKTTLDDVGRAVQLNKASLYYYFASKDDLFMAVVLRESAGFQQRLAESVRNEPEPAVRIHRYLTERLRYYQQVLNLNQLSLDHLQSLEPRFDVLYAQVKSQEVAFLAELLAQAGAADTARLAGLLLTVADAIKHAAVRATITRAITDVDFTAAEADITLVVNLVLRGLATSIV
jgi:AcrR family transcriptional regulator